MFWNKKEGKNLLPDLPPMKQDLQNKKITAEDSPDSFDISDRNSLPAFPDSPIKKGFTQAAIKDAVASQDEEDETIISPNEEKSFKIIEVADNSTDQSSVYSSKIQDSMQKIGIPPIPEPAILTQQKSIESRGSDMFIKIDKFYSAKKALSSTQEQLESIENILKKIRETKMREEQELALWEKEILQAKSRIQEVAKSIFEKS